MDAVTGKNCRFYRKNNRCKRRTKQNPFRKTTTNKLKTQRSFNGFHRLVCGPEGFSNKNSKCSKWVFDEFAVETAINCYLEHKKQCTENIFV